MRLFRAILSYFSVVHGNLVPGETIIYQAKLHWLIFVWPVILLLVAAVFFIYDITILGIIFIIPSILTWILSLITYYTAEFFLTNMRLIMKIGFIRRDSLDLLLKEVDAVRLHQNRAGRILNYGTIIVYGKGGLEQAFHKILFPLAFRNEIQNEILSPSASRNEIQDQIRLL